MVTTVNLYYVYFTIFKNIISDNYIRKLQYQYKANQNVEKFKQLIECKRETPCDFHEKNMLV